MIDYILYYDCNKLYFHLNKYKYNIFILIKIFNMHKGRQTNSISTVYKPLYIFNIYASTCRNAICMRIYIKLYLYIS